MRGVRAPLVGFVGSSDGSAGGSQIHNRKLLVRCPPAIRTPSRLAGILKAPHHVERAAGSTVKFVDRHGQLLLSLLGHR